jgi:hypothetical protein
VDTEMKQWPLTRWVMRYRITFLLLAGMTVVVTVAGVAGYSSWGHIVHVGRMVHEPAAAWLPVSIDGLMIAGATMQAIDRLRGFKPRPWATVSLWLGATATITYNVVSAWERGFWGCAVAVTPAVALLVLVEGATRPGRVVAIVQDAREAVQAIVAATATATPAPTATAAPAPAPAKRTRKPAPPGATLAVPATATPKPRARRTSSGLKATGPGTRPARPKIAPDVTADTVTVPSVDTVLPVNGRPHLQLVPAFEAPDAQQ